LDKVCKIFLSIKEKFGDYEKHVFDRGRTFISEQFKT